MNQMILALIIFVLMYACLLKLPDQRWLVALIAAGIFIVLGILPIKDILIGIDWNIILMLLGTMIVVELFIESKMPALLSERLLSIVPNVQWAVVALAAFAGIISAFVDNVATVLMVAPIGLAVSKKLNTNPVPIIISIAVASNLQGAATLVGDTTSILLGGYANMSFNDFIWMNGKPGIFFSTEIGFLLTIPVLLYLFKNEKATVESKIETTVSDYVPSFLMVGVVASLIIASQFENKLEITNGLICVIFALVGMIYEYFKEKEIDVFIRCAKAVDYQTLLLLIGLFLVIKGITNAGVIDAIAELFVTIGGDSLLLMYVLIVVASVVISAFVDNIPYVATMLPVVQGISTTMGIEPYVLYFGLLIGATLGGNLTPVGASANIAGIGILQKEGYEVSTSDFMRIGVPFTLIAVLGGSLFTWLIWA